MSALIMFTQEVSNHALAVHPLAGGSGILDWLTQKNAQTQTLLRAAAVTLGIIFVIIQAVMSRGAMARIIISVAASSLFVWGVFNVTANKDRVQNEFNSSGISTVMVYAGSTSR